MSAVVSAVSGCVQVAVDPGEVGGAVCRITPYGQGQTHLPTPLSTR